METYKEKSDDSANHYGGIKMSFVDTCTDMLISAIKNGSVYRQYCDSLEAVKQIPGLKEEVDELRRLNYRIQNQDEGINLYEAIDHIDDRMEELCKISEVNQFLEAELALCRQLQKIGAVIHQGIDLDVPDLS